MSINAVAEPSSARGLRETDLPALYHAADANSVSAQRRFLRASTTSLLLLIVAAGAGLFSWDIMGNGSVDGSGIIALIAFLITVLLRVYLLTMRPEQIWYQGRAAAEAIKTLAWCYAVGGKPFARDTKSPDDPDQEFLNRLAEIMKSLDELALIPADESGQQITAQMRALRHEPLSVRRQAYEQLRLLDQQGWYARKARQNRAQADRWGIVLLMIEILGIVAAFAKVVGLIQIDVLGLAGTLVAAGASWIQTKQHVNLAKSYAVASQELSAIKGQLATQHIEADWAKFMANAEQAIGREHSLWRALRGQK